MNEKESNDVSAKTEKQETANYIAQDVDGSISEECDQSECGYGPFKPACLQYCNRPGMLLTCICYFTFVQSFVCSGVTSVNISTLERRYQLTSGQIAWISGAYDIVAAILSVVYGYLGTFVHMGKLLSVAAFSMALGSLIFFLPHPIAGVYEIGQTGSDLCVPGGGYIALASCNSTDCNSEGSDLSNFLYVFILGHIFHAVGGSAIYVLSVPYMDSNIRIRNTPMYIGTMYAFAAIGPAFGYFLGGYFLSIYVDIGRVDMDSVTVEPGDPSWVGAWWIGYLVSSSMALIAGVLLCAFPRELPTAKLYRAERKSQVHKGKGEKETAADNFGKSGKDIWVSTKVLFINPIWILSTVAGIVTFGSIVAFAMFLPKLMQYQFSLTPGQAAGIAGMLVIPGAAGGFILGGTILKCMNLKTTGMIVVCIITSLITWVLTFIFTINCNMPGIAGVTVQYFDGSLELKEEQILHECNGNCSCTLDKYDPICGADGLQYFSPCYAGCIASDDTNGDEVFFGCSCINDSYVLNNETEAWAGMCDDDCSTQLAVYCILFLILTLALLAGNNAGQSIAIRCIPDKERAFSIGIQSCLIRFFGNVPMPLIFGAIFDQSCLLWQESCGVTGACWIYDSVGLGWGMTWAAFTACGIACICYVISYFVYTPPPDDTLATEASDKTEDDSSAISPTGTIENRAVGDCDKETEECVTRL